MEPDKIDYPALLQHAMRDVVRRVLEQVAEHGLLPSENHFLISFRTDAPGVEIPRFLRDQYPQELNIVLENQFWDLEVTPEDFSVVLSFGGSRQRLTIPFAALTVFLDRPANFGVRFEPLPQAGEPAQAPEAPREEAPEEEAPGVLRFDPSRKR